eukprot:CAMPEP_0184866062 /NCGR_PEP_ID=MMETSP0580-20130426/20586_1 /TAXON_ID=1118495 /ORGANISM="Dactyliosolen fragilissimus" /LENGTH=702 /DNA_ID=CAMNT_0027365525 /DNA_START=89 /DNA_END=2197 /DNA_ORIENTATION=-
MESTHCRLRHESFSTNTTSLPTLALFRGDSFSAQKGQLDFGTDSRSCHDSGSRDLANVETEDRGDDNMNVAVSPTNSPSKPGASKIITTLPPSTSRKKRSRPRLTGHGESEIPVKISNITDLKYSENKHKLDSNSKSSFQTVPQEIPQTSEITVNYPTSHRSNNLRSDSYEKITHFSQPYMTNRNKLTLSRHEDSSRDMPETSFPESRSGYPPFNSISSFTGSPIEECIGATNAKIRRLNLASEKENEGDSDDEERLNRNDMSIDDSHADDGFLSNIIQGRDNSFLMKINCNVDKTVSTEEISPTDVCNFPWHDTSTNDFQFSDGTPITGRKELKAPSSPSRPGNMALKRELLPETPALNRKAATRIPSFWNNSSSDDVTLSSQPKPSCRPKSRFLEDFKIIGTLGNGSFGTVYKCVSRLDDCTYAVKAAKRKAKGNADRDRMLKEVHALAALCDLADTASFHIVRYHQAWMEENRLHIQTELCSFTLQEEMSSQNGLIKTDSKRRYKLLRETLLACDLIHSNNLVHLDIKPENIFIKNNTFKLGDFGLVRNNNSSGQGDIDEGDSRYMSLDLLSFTTPSDISKCDVFSLGITMYEICTGRNLPSDGQEWQDLRAGNLSPMQNTHPELQKIIHKMMDPDPSLRPSAKVLLQNRQLLSEEQKQLIQEKNRVKEANFALKYQQDRFKKEASPPKNLLIRSHSVI